MIDLRILSKNDISPFYTWINDDEVIKFSLSLFLKIKTKDEINLWFTELIENDKIINYGIFLKSNGKLIGFTGVSDISDINKSGEFYIFIGDKNMWGKGIGTMVTKQILKIGFIDKGLNRIFLTVSAPNIGGIKAYEKAGFIIEGRLRQASFRDNKFHDKIIMSMLKSEWNNRKTTGNTSYNQ